MTSAESNPLPLDYAPAPLRRRKWMRRGICVGVVLVLGSVAWKWGAANSQQLKFLYWQHRCMTYTASPDMVVYEEEPLAAAKLIASMPSSYAQFAINRTSALYTIPEPPIKAAGYFSQECTQFTLALRKYFPQFATYPEQLLFMHERTSPAGHRRLVMVFQRPQQNRFTYQFVRGYNYIAEVITPAGLKTRPRIAPLPEPPRVVPGFAVNPPRVRIYAGQIDPKDASHFTIRYRMWDQEDVLDGYLDDNDQVMLKPRKEIQANW